MPPLPQSTSEGDEKIQSQLNETSQLISDLHSMQTERLSLPTPQHLSV